MAPRITGGASVRAQCFGILLWIAAGCQQGQYQTSPLVVDCNGIPSTTVDISLQKRHETLLVSLPAGVPMLGITLQADSDLDLQLYDSGGECIVGSGCKYTKSCSSTPLDYCIEHAGMMIFFSGDDTVPPIQETIRINGTLLSAMDFRVQAYGSGTGSATFSHDRLLECPAIVPGCSECEDYPVCGPSEFTACCLPYHTPKCNGGVAADVECIPSTTTTTSITSTTPTETTTSTTSTSVSLTETSTTTTTATTTSTSTGTTATGTTTFSTTSVTTTTTTVTKSTVTSTTTYTTTTTTSTMTISSMSTTTSTRTTFTVTTTSTTSTASITTTSTASTPTVTTVTLTLTTTSTFSTTTSISTSSTRTSITHTLTRISTTRTSSTTTTTTTTSSTTSSKSRTSTSTSTTSETSTTITMTTTTTVTTTITSSTTSTTSTTSTISTSSTTTFTSSTTSRTSSSTSITFTRTVTSTSITHTSSTSSSTTETSTSTSTSSTSTSRTSTSTTSTTLITTTTTSHTTTTSLTLTTTTTRTSTSITSTQTTSTLSTTTSQTTTSSTSTTTRTTTSSSTTTTTTTCGCCDTCSAFDISLGDVGGNAGALFTDSNGGDAPTSAQSNIPDIVFNESDGAMILALCMGFVLVLMNGLAILYAYKRIRRSEKVIPPKAERSIEMESVVPGDQSTPVKVHVESAADSPTADLEAPFQECEACGDDHLNFQQDLVQVGEEILDRALDSPPIWPEGSPGEKDENLWCWATSQPEKTAGYVLVAARKRLDLHAEAESQLREQTQQLQEQLDELSVSFADLNKKHETAEEKRRDLEQKLAENPRKVKQLKAHIAQITRERDSTEAERLEFERQATETLEKCRLLETQVCSLEEKATLEAALESTSHVPQEVAALKARLHEVSHAYNNVARTRAELIARVTNQATAGLHRTVHALRVENEQLRVELVDKDARIQRWSLWFQKFPAVQALWNSQSHEVSTSEPVMDM